MKRSWLIASAIIALAWLIGRADSKDRPAEEFDAVRTGSAPADADAPSAPASPARSADAVEIFTLEPDDGTTDGWYSAVGFYYVKPVLFMFENDLDFSLDFANSNFAPRFWLGRQFDDGWGARIRYWFLDSDGQREFLFVDENETGSSLIDFTVDLNLQLHVLDLENTRQARCFGVNWLFSGGVRIAYLRQEFDTELDFSYDGEGLSTSGTLDFHFTDRFTGLGPTAAVEARVPIRNSNFAVYGMGRGALLIGTRARRLDGLFSATGVNEGQPFETDLDIHVSARDEEIIPVGEVELGLEWTRDWGRRQVFVQVAGVAQVYGNALDFSNANPILNTLINGQLGEFGEDLGNASEDYPHGFFGFTLTAGLTW